MAAVLRGYTADQQLAEVTRVQKWLKALPMAKRVLVKVLTHSSTLGGSMHVLAGES